MNRILLPGIGMPQSANVFSAKNPLIAVIIVSHPSGRWCRRRQIRFAPENIAASHPKLRSKSYARGRRSKFLCAMSCFALAPRLSPALIWTSIRCSPTTYEVGGVRAPLCRDAHTLPRVEKKKKKETSARKITGSKQRNCVTSFASNKICGLKAIMRKSCSIIFYVQLR